MPRRTTSVSSTSSAKAARSLRETWRDGAYAYLGMAVPGFPNFFMLYGPNTNVGSNSVIFMLEAQARYIVRVLKHMRRKRKLLCCGANPTRWRSSSPRSTAWMQGTVWLTRCSNYFRAANGRVVTQWPRSARAFWDMTRRFKAKPTTPSLRRRPPGDGGVASAAANR